MPARRLLSVVRRASSLAVLAAALCASRAALAQNAQPGDPAPSTEPAPSQPPPLPPAKDPLNEPPATSPANPPASPAAPPPPPSPRFTPTDVEPAPVEEEAKPMSEGRAIVVAWNTGFQWGIAPGIIFQSGKTGFFLGVRLGYGFDTGSVIVVPGVRLAAYFTDPNVYLGMPVLKLVYPIDRFAPFIEGGGGVGHIAAAGTGLSATDSATGAAVMGGGGFMIHFTPRFALGVEANYTAITGTGFKGFGVGPIIALAF